jgi:hypothetical protein
MATDMDYLVIGNFVLSKGSQSGGEAFTDHVNQFELD